MISPKQIGHAAVCIGPAISLDEISIYDCRPVWHFFDLKAYLIMAVMMGGGIGLRSSGLVPDVFIAVFYTGLGCALALAGVMFWIMFFSQQEL